MPLPPTGRRLQPRLHAWPLLLPFAAAVAVAQDAAPAAPAAAPPAAAAASAPAAARFEGAVGLVLSHHPSYQGSADARTRLQPGIFLRYGRWTVTTTGGFVTRSHEEVPRGLTADLVRRDDLRVKLSLRLDGGRDANADDALAGLSDVRPTVRGHLSVQRRFGGGWSATLGFNPDLLGRGGGLLANAGLGHTWSLGPRQTLDLGLGLTLADRRYLRSYFGVNPAESPASGYRVYQPGPGLRDVGLTLGWHGELGPHWVAFAGGGLGRLLGPAADSPLTRRAGSWSLNGGLAWRF